MPDGWKSIADIEGIIEKYARDLRQAGIQSVRAFLERGATPEGREAIAEESGVSPSLILEWINIADLLRIKGVGKGYANLLEQVGVDTVPNLAHRDPGMLHERMVEINEENVIVRRLPAESQVADWIRQAKGLPRKVTY